MVSIIVNLKFLLLLLSFSPLYQQKNNSGAVSAQNLQNYIDQYTGEVRSFDPSRPLTIIIRNKSQHVADIHALGKEMSGTNRLATDLGTVDVNKQLKLDINMPFTFFRDATRYEGTFVRSSD